ncbi:MAG: DUF4230 domain-containing protein [Treponema sp.]|nr:DUF4230 domain-containing protein [Treponema sp.]
MEKKSSKKKVPARPVRPVRSAMEEAKARLEEYEALEQLAEERLQKQKGSTIRLVKFFVFIFVILAACLGAYYGWKKFTKIQIERKYSTISSQIQEVAELTAIKYTYNDVVSIKKSAVGGMSKAYSIVKYTGIIRVGIRDVSDIGINISPDGNSVSVKVPRSEILENALLSQEVFDEKDGVFVGVNTKEVMEEIKRAMEGQLASIKESGIEKDADKKVKSLLESMIKGAGYDSVSVKIGM